jgi:hypothetical protein
MILSKQAKTIYIRGNYVAFENEQAVCKKGTLKVSNGIVADILPYDSKVDGVVTLADDEVIFPGLADLHTHHTYNMIPIWTRPETIEYPWDNRFEWRTNDDYTKNVEDVYKKLKTDWNKSFKVNTNGDVAYGDLLLYFAELQAVAGGSTILQEKSSITVSNNTQSKASTKTAMIKSVKSSSSVVDTVDSHNEEDFEYPFLKKQANVKTITKRLCSLMNVKSLAEVQQSDTFSKAHLLLRSTGIASELGVEDADSKSQINAITDLFTPTDNTNVTPHYDTSKWTVGDAIDKVNKETIWKELSDKLIDISNNNGTTKGYIVHLAEGRAGNLCPDKKGIDGYSEKEFSELKKRINDLIADKSNSVTNETIQKIHMNLIHGCGIDIKDESNYKFLKDNKIGLIWSPVSNLILYEDTPTFYENIKKNDIVLGLGSDWSPSGSKHVWDECKFAYKYLNSRLENDEYELKEDVLKMVTLNASKLIDSTKIGNVKKDGFADFFVLKSNKPIDANKKNALDTFFNVSDENVQFVMIGGNIIYGESSYFEKFADKDNPISSRFIPSTDDKLKNKKVYMPEAIDIDLEKAINELDTELSTKRSKFRSSEDKDYRTQIEGLENKFVTHAPLKYFNDTDFVKNRKRITEIVLHTGWIVDGIQFIYDNDPSSRFHGGRGGYQQRYKMQDGEYIVSITGKIGNYEYNRYSTICSIEIRTNKGKVIRGGEERACWNLKNFSFTAENGKQVFALSGCYNGYLCGLDAYTKEVSK